MAGSNPNLFAYSAPHGAGMRASFSRDTRSIIAEARARRRIESRSRLRLSGFFRSL